MSKQNLHIPSCQQSRLVQLVLVQQRRILHWCWGHFPPASPSPTAPVAYTGHTPCSLQLEEISFSYSTTKLISCLSFSSVPVLNMQPLCPSTCQPQNLPVSDRSICLLQSLCFDLAPAFMQPRASFSKPPIYLLLPLVWLSQVSSDWSPGVFLIILRTFPRGCLLQTTRLLKFPNEGLINALQPPQTMPPGTLEVPHVSEAGRTAFVITPDKTLGSWMLMPQLNLKPELSREEETGRKDGKLRKAINTEALCYWDCRYCEWAHQNNHMWVSYWWWKHAEPDRAGNRHFPGRTQDEKALSTP